MAVFLLSTVLKTLLETPHVSTTRVRTQAFGTALQVKDPELTFLLDLIKAVLDPKTLLVSTLDSLHNN